ncbi:hypothetical protein [Sphingobium sp. KCTC 72723]|uniref:hypothetical protein n=1 Tax=Sphingobium sp. KCTC 72723 TaxID=2733867 RepID=UPI00165E5D22|nr:hypothetical protein [Sphingobium sp. KCTC 72723]
MDDKTIALTIKDDIFATLDQEQMYGEEGAAERLRDQFADFYSAKGFNVYVDDQGKTQNWYLGLGLPQPLKLMTAADKKRLEKQFYHKRIKDAAERTIALRTAKEAKFRYSVDAKSYSRRTEEVLVTFTKPEQALMFKLAFDKKEAA